MTPDEAKKIVLAEYPSADSCDCGRFWIVCYLPDSTETQQLFKGATEPEAWINAAENIKERK